MSATNSVIRVAKSAGFCFGVRRSVDIVLTALKYGAVYTLGPIIHNDDVVSELERLGASPISEISGKLDRPVIIRSHGVSESVLKNIAGFGNTIIDATCPFVKKIHKLVQEERTRKIVIVGDRNHPEVLGIYGHVIGDNVIIIDENSNLETLFSLNDDIMVVSQTTFNVELWKKIVKFLKNTCKSVYKSDTICSATKKRQLEAIELSKSSDAVIVIGDKKSSNTKKLYDAASTVNNEVYIFQRASEIDPRKWRGKNISITAGASTPDWIIKEVVMLLEERVNEIREGNEEVNFEEAFEQSLVTLNTGDIVKGTILSVTPTEVLVDLGFKADGIIPVGELTDDPNIDPKTLVKPGDEISVFVVRVNDQEGSVLLSKKKLDSLRGWQLVEESMQNDTILHGRIIEAIKGGVIVLYEGVRVFIPASQASERYVNDLATIVNTQVPFKIIDVNKRRRKVVGTIKPVLIEERKRLSEDFWNNVEVGKPYKAVVKTLTQFGAFVDLGGVDGLVHVSELSWSRIKHPNEVLNIGDLVEVYVKDANKETGKVSLGFKKSSDDPWKLARDKYNEGDVAKVKVVRLVPFGAFVELEPNIDALIHVSQIANRRIEKPQDVLTIGDEIEAQIVEIDWANKKIGMSIRTLLIDEPAQAAAENNDAKKETSQDYFDNTDAPATLAENMAGIKLDAPKKS